MTQLTNVNYIDYNMFSANIAHESDFTCSTEQMKVHFTSF